MQPLIIRRVVCMYKCTIYILLLRHHTKNLPLLTVKSWPILFSEANWCQLFSAVVFESSTTSLGEIGEVEGTVYRVAWSCFLQFSAG